MIIALLEDNLNAAQEFELAVHARSLEIEVEVVSSESEFIDCLHVWREAPPDAVVADIMLRWARAVPSAPARPDWYTDSSRYRAGIRCIGALAKEEKTSTIPMVLYTILQRYEIEGDVKAAGLQSVPIVRKSEGFEGLSKALRRAGLRIDGRPG